MRHLAHFFLQCLLAISTSTAATAADPVRALRSDLIAILSDSRLADAQLAVEVLSLDRAEVLFEKNSRKLFIPASNNKILTAAAALVCLGPDYCFKTQVWADGPIRDGALEGDLIIKGFGDPSSSSRIQPKDPYRPFRDWPVKLKQHGITSISGKIIGDGGAFESTEHGRGWAWDDLAEGYAAPVSALQFNENLVELEIAPGLKLGSVAPIKSSPLENYLNLDVRVITESEDASSRIDIERSAGNEAVAVRGAIALKSAPVYRNVSVQFPILYYLSALKRILSGEGIKASGCEILQVRDYRRPSSSMLWVHASPPLAELLAPIMKNSLNLGCETLTRVLGLELRGEGSFAKGKEVVEDALLRMGIGRESYAYFDGSGLSRLNLVSADAVVRILKFMHRQTYFPAFYNSLAVAGVDGTLASRLKSAKTINNVHAKTGSFANVSALSGYIRTADSETLAFSILANNFLVSRSLVEDMQEKALARLAGFSRKVQKKSIKR